MATYNFGIVALHPLSVSSHVLGFTQAKGSGYILECWAGSSDTAFVAGVTAVGEWRAGTPGVEDATTTTGPFTFLRTVNGPPTGTPNGSPTGEAALVYDRANHQIYAWYNGTWRKTAALT